MNPVYSPGSSGVPYANAKGVGYPAGFPMGYAAAAPAYSPSMYPGASPAFQTVCSSTCQVVDTWVCAAPAVTTQLLLRPWHTLQSVLLPHQRGGATLLVLTHPLPGCGVPRAQRLPPAEPLRTAGRLLRPAPVRGAPARHPPHHGGAAQRHAGDRVPRAHPSSARQRGRHGHGGRDHDGHVSRHPADGALPNSRCPPPRHRAHVPGPRDAHLQLRAPAVVITANVQDGAGRRVLDVPQLVLQASRLNQDSLLLLSTDTRLNMAWPASGPRPGISN